MRALAPPPTIPQNWSATRGKLLFSQLGCAGCHAPSLTTASNPASFIPPSTGGTRISSTLNQALAQKTFHPYCDFLLHSMGRARRRDHVGQCRSDYDANGALMGAHAPNPSTCTTAAPPICRPQSPCTTAKAKQRRKRFSRYRRRSSRMWCLFSTPSNVRIARRIGRPRAFLHHRVQGSPLPKEA